jgi:uncharacterized protein with von Willebrand factor type A (vWA) domain
MKGTIVITLFSHMIYTFSYYNFYVVRPGVQWRSNGVDLYDCRREPWYISAVTCSKDVVILLDVSGSMTGMPFSIAKFVAQSLLETLTSNDFVSVLKFSDVVTSPVPCFDDILVQVIDIKIINDSKNVLIRSKFLNNIIHFSL